MERAHRPPPLTLTPPHSRQSSISKTISVKGGSPGTTTISVFEEDDWNTGRWVTALRVLSDFGHTLVCIVPILIMAFFLGYDGTVINDSTGSSAVVLITLLSLDVLLDFQSIGRYDKMWMGWALAGRMLLALGYTALFVAYVAVGGAFPAGYTYWGLSAEAASPMVYVFLWTLGIWDFVYCAISRVQLIKEARRYRNALFPSYAAKPKSRLNTARGWDVEGAAAVPGQAGLRR
ncbi:uncharacterized protein DNG_01099 [Cephalotrichum gorgonifer]|uniref:Uncharacterized protein n=1 Tax=Cephalotrichum gorgonifer TaxID=2041049 RepID=A0AAE8SRJ0_9PEZI|nr:uncharacterized protein DNG_01099 [Cephalotrichum gorgonifer]